MPILFWELSPIFTREASIDLGQIFLQATVTLFNRILQVAPTAKDRATLCVDAYI